MKGAAHIFSVALTLSLTASVWADALQQTVVFQSGVGGYNTYRIPAIVQAANGNLLAFAEGRKNSASDTGDIDLVLKRSTDGGKTWGALQLVSSDGANTVGNPVPIVDSSTGRIYLLTTHNLGQDTLSEIINGTSDGTRTIWLQSSDDNGATWTSPAQITSSVKGAGWTWYATGPGHGIQLTRGAHAGRLVVPANFDSPTSNGALEVYSDDHGVTWHMGGLMLSGGGLNPSESSAVELTNGNVYFNSRNRGGSAPHYRAQAYSTDGGATFANGGIADELVDPIVQGSDVRYSAIDKGGAENRILFSNPADPADRRRMTVRSSFDETQTWNAGKLINRGPSAYSDLVALSSGSGGLLYENGPSTYHDQITYAGFGTSWLNDPSLAQYDFRSRSIGQTVAANSNEADQRGNGRAGVIQGSPVTIAGDPRFANTSSTALHFDGSDDMIRSADTGDDLFDFEASDSFSLEVDFRTTHHSTGGANGSGPLISKDVGSNTPSYWLRVENGFARFFLDDGSSTTSIIGSTFVADGNWHHLVAVRDAEHGELRLYLDEGLDGSKGDLTSGSFANDNDLLIGAFNASSAGVKRFEGDIAFARISGEALSPAQFVQMVPEPSIACGAFTTTLLLLKRRRD
jgi:sialidase-1